MDDDRCPEMTRAAAASAMSAAERRASFLADLKDYRAAGLRVDQVVVDRLCMEYGFTHSERLADSEMGIEMVLDEGRLLSLLDDARNGDGTAKLASRLSPPEPGTKGTYRVAFKGPLAPDVRVVSKFTGKTRALWAPHAMLFVAAGTDMPCGWTIEQRASEGDAVAGLHVSLAREAEAIRDATRARTMVMRRRADGIGTAAASVSMTYDEAASAAARLPATGATYRVCMCQLLELLSRDPTNRDALRFLYVMKGDLLEREQLDAALEAERARTRKAAG